MTTSRVKGTTKCVTERASETDLTTIPQKVAFMCVPEAPLETDSIANCTNIRVICVTEGASGTGFATESPIFPVATGNIEATSVNITKSWMNKGEGREKIGSSATCLGISPLQMALIRLNLRLAQSYNYYNLSAIDSISSLLLD